MPYEVVVQQRDGFEYGKRSDGTPDVLRFGQVITLKGLPNDARLMGLGYFVKWDEDLHQKERCDCGRDFANESFRQSHLYEHEGIQRRPDNGMSTLRIPATSAELEERALTTRGLEVKNRRAQAEGPLPDPSRECPMGCGESFLPAEMREHVVSCGTANQAPEQESPASALAEEPTPSTKGRAKTELCSKGCGNMYTKQGIRMHEMHCKGG